MLRVILVGLGLVWTIGQSSLVVGQDQLASFQDFLQPLPAIKSKELDAFVDRVAGNTRVVGLGEVSHYTKECYVFKREIVKRLMENGLNGLILEVDFGQALLWNEYVVHGHGELDQLVAQSGWFTYRTQEFKDLLQLIRTHNQSHDRPFQVFGMEMTAINHNLAWIKAFVEKHLPNEPSTINILKQIEGQKKSIAFQIHEPDEIIHCWQLHFDIKRLLRDQATRLNQSASPVEMRVAHRIAETLRQYATYVSQSDNSLRAEFRDQFSSRNVGWCLEHLGQGSRVAVWAHNGHIMRSATDRVNYDVLGHYLARWFGDQYYAIGFTFDQGEFGAYGEGGFQTWKISSATEDSWTRELTAMGHPYLIWDLRQSRGADAADRLSEARSIRADFSESHGAGRSEMMSTRIADTFDALIYFETSSLPTTIPWLQADQ